jgi:hypothetical protein
MPGFAFKVVIPARYASTRLPAKPLLDLGGTRKDVRRDRRRDRLAFVRLLGLVSVVEGGDEGDVIGRAVFHELLERESGLSGHHDVRPAVRKRLDRVDVRHATRSTGGKLAFRDIRGAADDAE